MKNIFILLGVLLITASFAPKSVEIETNIYPKPEGINNLLFYVQRTINSNTIVYTLNQDKDGNLNEKEPIKAYWVKYAQGGKIDPLTYIQRNYAYGIQSKMVDAEKKTFSFEFVSYHKKQFYLLKSASDKKYHVYSFINNKLSILNNILVKIEGGTFWVPNVKYAEVKAFDPSALTEVTEIIKP